jgi:hypothetical protein
MELEMLPLRDEKHELEISTVEEALSLAGGMGYYQVRVLHIPRARLLACRAHFNIMFCSGACFLR